MAKQFTTSIYREPVKKRTSIGYSVRSRPKNKHKKRTSQGSGRGTKFGTKPEGKAGKKQLQRYKKRSRGQGK